MKRNVTESDFTFNANEIFGADGRPMKKVERE